MIPLSVLRFFPLVTIALLALIPTANLSAQDPLVQLEAFIKASNTGGGDVFGRSVALSGDTAVVGAASEDGASGGVNGGDNNDVSGSGAAYVYVRSGTTWLFQAYLKAAQPVANAKFGQSVAISGDTIIVGAPDDGNGTATVFVRQGGVWTLQATLVPSDPTANRAISQPVKSNCARSCTFRVLSPKLTSVPCDLRLANAAILSTGN